MNTTHNASRKTFDNGKSMHSFSYLADDSLQLFADIEISSRIVKRQDIGLGTTQDIKQQNAFHCYRKHLTLQSIYERHQKSHKSVSNSKNRTAKLARPNFSAVANKDF